MYWKQNKLHTFEKRNFGIDNVLISYWLEICQRGSMFIDQTLSKGHNGNRPNIVVVNCYLARRHTPPPRLCTFSLGHFMYVVIKTSIVSKQ